jgi:hypothetical protein
MALISKAEIDALLGGFNLTPLPGTLKSLVGATVQAALYHSSHRVVLLTDKGLLSLESSDGTLDVGGPVSLDDVDAAGLVAAGLLSEQRYQELYQAYLEKMRRVHEDRRRQQYEALKKEFE